MGWSSVGFEPAAMVRFSIPVQTDPEAHAAFCAMDTGSLSWGQSSAGVV